MIELDLKELTDLLITRAQDLKLAIFKYNADKLSNSITACSDITGCQYALGDIEAATEELKRKMK